jgi:DHA1 family multidrug resistance protein-like MFS transporter
MKGWLFNKALRILLITNGLVMVAGAMLGPIYALFVKEIGGNLLDASLTGAFFALGAGITTLIAGKIADKSKRDERIVAIGYAIMGIGFLLYMFVNSIWFLFGVQLLVGFAEAFYSPAFDSLYTRHTTRSKVGREWSVWEASHYFSITIGSVIGGLIVTYFGFNTIFTIMAVLCFISAIYIFHLHKRIL